MSAPLPRAVVFDFDGVLANTEDLHLHAFQETFAARSWSLTREAYFSNYLGFDDRGLIRAFTRDNGFEIGPAGVEDILLDKAKRYEQRIADGAVLFPTAAAAVARLGASFRLAIASGSLRGEILAILKANKLDSAFPVVVGADDVERSKPAPDPYIAAVARLGVPAASALAIEDAPLGVRAAQLAGLKTIGITTSYPAQALTAADAVVDSLDEITPAMVRSLLREGSDPGLTP